MPRNRQFEELMVAGVLAAHSWLLKAFELIASNSACCRVRLVKFTL
jgi:hypothetical protein